MRAQHEAKPAAAVSGDNIVPNRIYLWGAPTVEWLNVVADPSDGPGGRSWPLHRRADVFLSPQPGGTALLASLLDHMVPGGEDCVKRADADKAIIGSCSGILGNDWTIHRKYRNDWTLWKQHTDGKIAGSSTAQKVFRYAAVTNRENGSAIPELHTAADEPDRQLLVLDDPGAGDAWINGVLARARSASVDAVLLHLDANNYASDLPITESPLYQGIANDSGLAPKTTILTSVRDLRGAGVRVSTSLSWEKMLDDVVTGVLIRLSKVKRVIVTIGLSGVVIVEREQQSEIQQQQTLIFDHRSQEDDFEGQHPGRVVGYATCMLAALATAWAELPSNAARGTEVDWHRAARVGLRLMRHLHRHGYELSLKPAHRRVLQFPFAAIGEYYYRFDDMRHLRRPEKLGRHSAAQTGNRPAPDRADPGDIIYIFQPNNLRFYESGNNAWTILQEELSRSYSSEHTTPAQSNQEVIALMACGICKDGPDVKNVRIPVERVGKWVSADRNEIEGVRCVRNAMRDYQGNHKENKPLSIAVFGPPGSGKSFVVTEIADSLGLGAEHQLTFNLSQYKDPAELVNAFQEVRDLQLMGKTPLVFWDEFDSERDGQALGWLRYFLSPMQDGKFADRGSVHPIGKGIHIFAGGTSPTFKQFAQISHEFERTAKKPDFISRLRAYIDVKGPNPAPAPEADDLFMIRRAFLIRSCLERFVAHLLNDKEQIAFDPGVLNALLRTTAYRHGARSLESVIRLCNFSDVRKFELSSLPPTPLLEMHVESVRDFMSYLHAPADGVCISHK